MFWWNVLPALGAEPSDPAGPAAEPAPAVDPAAVDPAAEAPAAEVPATDSRATAPALEVPAPPAVLAPAHESAAAPGSVGGSGSDAPPLSSADPGALRPETTGGDDVLVTFGLLYGGYAGAEMGWLVGEATEQRESDHLTAGLWPGMLGGAVAGVTTAALLDRSRSLAPESEALLLSSSAHGLYYGAQAARALIPPDAPGADERIHAAGLAGSMLGTGLGVAFGDRAAPIEDQVGFGVATGIGWITGTGIADLAGLGLDPVDQDGDGVLGGYRLDRRPRAAVTLGATLAMDGVAMIGNRVARPGPGSLALSIGHGTWIGGWSPLLFDDRPSANQVTGGLRLGLGAGYASALLLGAAGEPDATSAGLQIAGWAAGSALGAGIPLSMEQEGPAAAVVGPMLLGGIGGQVLGAVVAPRYELQREDALLVGTLGAWSSYQALGWGLYASATTDQARQPFGYALTAAGAGTLVTLGLTPALDVAPSGSLMLLSSGGWGTWYGAWASELAELSPEETWLVTLGAGNGALLASGVAQAAGFRPDWTDVGAIDGLGLAGAAAGGLGGVIFLYDPDDWDPLVISTLAGTSIGLAAGSYVAAISDDGGLPRLGRLRAPKVQADLVALPLPGEDGDQGLYVRLDVKEAR